MVLPDSTRSANDIEPAAQQQGESTLGTTLTTRASRQTISGIATESAPPNDTNGYMDDIGLRSIFDITAIREECPPGQRKSRGRCRRILT